ncbi:GNAT family N-acetyltransferase [Marinomonas sp. 15G1-11]|uniref:GNAT family N-acetyltransferase n=1 Tax=Marinomonas phaeophyticola TaxID=3004091 RepID=A0ABT4JWS9_9GAMM|nr:GNAT family N-acetyltransferase [Marinomonas sp. 15G1-11]MCZ2722537.1 GNAT family N-acetyltransferase [Marinomonas sp. 15G1-11]
MDALNSHLYTVEQSSRLLFPLTKKFYQAYYPAGKPNKADPIWLLKENTIVCAYRLKQLSHCQLLTAMVTRPSHRKQGLGSLLLQQTQKALLSRPTYCFAFEHLEPFYIANGFLTLPKEALPDELLERFIRYTLSGKKLVPMRFTQSTYLKST